MKKTYSGAVIFTLLIFLFNFFLMNKGLLLKSAITAIIAGLIYFFLMSFISKKIQK
jgi:hypothetical protein